MRSIDTGASDPTTHALALRLARRCRRIVQACLREEEWGDADREFYRIIRRGIEAMRDGNPPAGGREGNDRQAGDFTGAEQGVEER